jgi:hypothetical protein
MGSVNAVPRMSAAATRTDRASHGLPGERVLADRGRIRELADDGPVRSMSQRSLVGGLRIQLREHDLPAVWGEDRAGLRLRERIRQLVKVRPIGSQPQDGRDPIHL